MNNFMIACCVLFMVIISMGFLYLFQPQAIKHKMSIKNMISNNECANSGNAYIDNKELTIYTCKDGRIYIL